MIAYLRSFCGFGLIGLLMIVAVLTLSACGSSAPRQRDPSLDTDLERFNRAARLAFDKGRFDQAASFYRRALERAYLRDDTAAILDAHYNLALCLMNLESYEKALEVVRRAKAEMALVDDGKSLDFSLLEATILQRDGRLDQAWQMTDNILSAPEQPSSIVKSKTYFLRGLIASEQDNLVQLRTSIDALGQTDDLQLRANRQELLGRLAMSEQNWDAAIDSFVRTINLRRKARDYRGMVRVLVLAGEASEKAERTREAAVFYLRAGRSAVLQNHLDDARQWLNHAVKLATTAEEDKIAEEARSFLRQIEELTANGSDRSG